MTGPLYERRALNEHTCARCGRVIVAEFPICPPCAEHLERLDLAREVLAQAQLDRGEFDRTLPHGSTCEHRWPPPRRRPRS